ncbi:acetoacetyl-CoA synthetase [Sistotremastrum niveocremeum HHB9708]|uniref:Acetoacetyl-CoA synthetase n=1 Tax=Sistotremastrum niveocremeum HHB9708 TaxID=1314777 RepID=A0A165A803_9AGAM|nr:acetoacetyl-CoA synthetase [Sistotremastrum niveocremeum HHB9708]
MQSEHWEVPKLIWQHPDPALTRIEVLRHFINHKHGFKFKNYYELYEYSVSDWTFWKDLWEFLGIISSVPPTQVIIEAPLVDSPRWFPNARLNYAENILFRNDDAIACTVARETGFLRHYSSRELREMVRVMRNAMRANGLKAGDRVAAIVTNSIDPIVIAMAASSIGAIYSSTAPDMGVSGILDRYRQIRPKFVFSETEVLYAGKQISIIPKIVQVANDLAHHGLERVIVFPSSVTGKDVNPRGIKNCSILSAFLSEGRDEPLAFEQLPFDHPLYILYSSGTTGPPKCIVHTAGGVLLQNKKAAATEWDIRFDDTHFQYTTCAWMMWNAMLGALAVGARLILYDGSPFHPSVRSFLKFINDQRVTHIGTSPRFLSEIQGQGIRPLDLAPFETLRCVYVTGAVLTPPLYEWAITAFPKRAHVNAGSGGTDICAGFIGACTPLPGYSGEMQVKSIGMKVEIFDPEGNNIEDTGFPGELVCTRAHPSIPLGFWGDEGRKKFFNAYFAKYPGVWTQGDFIVKNPKTQGLIILGRSDGVLNPSGVRFGSGEIYTVMDQFSHVVDDSLCIGQRRPQDKDERVLLFLKMRPGITCTEDLKVKIRGAIKTALSARHVPAYIFEVAEIPYTVNNKKIEIAVKQIVSGSTLKPSGTVANPDSLKLYYKYVDLEALVGQPMAKL